ncbi:MAG: PQQ-binding-like beta-propeller repeat protein [Deltaproteobacteria bacterium]|nr:PQQ-binding-like beta-propeller repeat protein [Deltaproteobacteria bacterium]
MGNDFMLARNSTLLLPVLALIVATGCDTSSPALGESDPQVEDLGAGLSDDDAEQPSDEPARFVPAPQGCSMAHCDPQMSDQSLMPAPSPDSAVVWKDTEAAGSNFALGCVSNGERVACSFGGNLQPGPYLKVYDGQGTVLWTSVDADTGLDRLNKTAFASAPMIDAQGGVIAVDNNALIRFDDAGHTVWSTPQTGGLPISPGLTDDGVIVLGTNDGVVAAYDSSTGEVLGTLILNVVEAGRVGTSSRATRRQCWATPCSSRPSSCSKTVPRTRCGTPSCSPCRCLRSLASHSWSSGAIASARARGRRPWSRTGRSSSTAIDPSRAPSRRRTVPRTTRTSSRCRSRMAPSAGRGRSPPPRRPRPWPTRGAACGCSVCKRLCFVTSPPRTGRRRSSTWASCPDIPTPTSLRP